MSTHHSAWLFLFLGAQALAQTPSEAQIIQAQGTYARSQLSSIAAVLSVAPAASAREAFQSGNAPMNWRHFSPGLGTVARGPTLKESIAPLLSNIAAARMGCESLEGPCLSKATKSGTDAARRVLLADHPGKALLSALSDDKR